MQKLLNKITKTLLKEEEVKNYLIKLMELPEQKKSVQALFIEPVAGKAEKNSVDSDLYTLILNGKIQNPGCEPANENILIHKDKIAGTSKNLPDNLPDCMDSIQFIDADGLVITPGLIDQHLHGGYSFNFNTSDSEEIINFAQNITKHGVTTIVPTIMTDTPENMKKQISEITTAKNNLPANAAKIEGIHIEGPFLNPEFKGIHSESLFIKPAVENFKYFETDEIRIVTYAPELDKNFEFARYLSEKNIVCSAGHTKSDFEDIENAVKNGLRQVTHLFNAMSPIHHRKPGIIGAALTNDRLFIEVIADNNHLHPAIVDLILRAKPKNKIIFISDSLPLNESPESSAIFGGQEIFRNNGIAANKEGRFAGSLSFLDEIIRKNINKISFGDLIQFCSKNPAINLDLKDRGYIRKGNTADFVLWNENYKVVRTVINGQPAL